MWNVLHIYELHLKYLSQHKTLSVWGLYIMIIILFSLSNCFIFGGCFVGSAGGHRGSHWSRGRHGFRHSAHQSSCRRWRWRASRCHRGWSRSSFVHRAGGGAGGQREEAEPAGCRGRGRRTGRGGDKATGRGGVCGFRASYHGNRWRGRYSALSIFMFPKNMK